MVTNRELIELKTGHQIIRDIDTNEEIIPDINLDEILYLMHLAIQQAKQEILDTIEEIATITYDGATVWSFKRKDFEKLKQEVNND